MAEFGTFDLARAYATAEDVKASQQGRELRGLQIDAAKKALAKPEEISYEQALGHARLAYGAASSVASDPSDQNVRRQFDILTRSGSLTPGITVDRVLALPPAQRSEAAKQWVGELGPFLQNAAEPQKATSPGYGAPQSGINPATGKPEQFIVDDSGNVKWLGIAPEPNAGGQGRSDYYSPVYTADGVMGFDHRRNAVSIPTGAPAVTRTVDDPVVQGNIAGAKESATLNAQRAQQIEVKVQNMGTMDSMLDEASPLVAVATGSGIGAITDKVASWIGFSPSGADAIAALGVMSARLLEMVPRMEGPQSDADRSVYEAAVGNLAKAGVPRDQKLAAIRTIRTLNKKYKLEFGANSTAQQRTVVRTGTKDGKKVVEYSDGTIDYAPQ